MPRFPPGWWFSPSSERTAERSLGKKVRKGVVPVPPAAIKRTSCPRASPIQSEEPTQKPSTSTTGRDGAADRDCRPRAGKRWWFVVVSSSKKESASVPRSVVSSPPSAAARASSPLPRTASSSFFQSDSVKYPTVPKSMVHSIGSAPRASGVVGGRGDGERPPCGSASPAEGCAVAVVAAAGVGSMIVKGYHKREIDGTQIRTDFGR
mmetsp:Transcript_34877/g.73167  ORF Transcript_34877/g.73167 Transcript_34877/m.73167 type:complete len:207 (-) Transcript_34877:155-775(-)